MSKVSSRKTTSAESSDSLKPSNESAPTTAPTSTGNENQPVPLAKLKYKPDTGWNDKTNCYVCRVLTVPPQGGSSRWYAWPKDMPSRYPVREGTGQTEQEAIDEARKNFATAIKRCVESDPPEPVAFVEVSGVRYPGSQLRFIRVDAPPPSKKPNK